MAATRLGQPTSEMPNCLAIFTSGATHTRALFFERPMGVVVVVLSGLSLVFVVHLLLSVPIQGSIALFLAAAALHLFATTSLGISLATFARSMPQFGLLLMLTLLPMNMLSGQRIDLDSMLRYRGRHLIDL